MNMKNLPNNYKNKKININLNLMLAKLFLMAFFISACGSSTLQNKLTGTWRIQSSSCDGQTIGNFASDSLHEYGITINGETGYYYERNPTDCETKHYGNYSYISDTVFKLSADTSKPCEGNTESCRAGWCTSAVPTIEKEVSAVVEGSTATLSFTVPSEAEKGPINGDIYGYGDSGCAEGQTLSITLTKTE